MKTFLVFVLSCLLAIPAFAESPKFDTFLVKFRYLYDVYHLGPRLHPKDVDLIAVRIWHGAGQNYHYASLTACQGIFETHYNRDISHGGHKGDIGMRNFTILAEAKRLGLIKTTKEKWMLRYCEKNPAFANKLAASRFVYLIGLATKKKEPERFVIYQWVRGLGWQKDDEKGKKDLQDVQRYYNGVVMLRNEVFKENE